MTLSLGNPSSRDIELLRLATAGSVDDGKSTLIGRLLFDAHALFDDQVEAIQRTSQRFGRVGLDLSFVTDGLRAEREQSITIDVAYRYFATPRRRFIIADTPGHVQYTRNMVTGASTADLALILIDARKGVLSQSRRHGFIASLLGVPHVAVAVNKMDLVDYSQAVFENIVESYRSYATRLRLVDLVFIPLSALHGDNVVQRSDRMAWYGGSTLLHYLETVGVRASHNLLDFRLPVQYVIRPHQDYRGYAGRIASGTIRAGQDVVVLPSGRRARVLSIDSPDGPLSRATAAAGDAVVVRFDEELDVSRGDMIARRDNLPIVSNALDAMLCWMDDGPMDPATTYILLHATRSVRAKVSRVVYRIDVDSLHREDTDHLACNEIGRVELATSEPIFFDPFVQNRATGSFILVHPVTHATVAAGMLRGELRTASTVNGVPAPSNAIDSRANEVISREEREKQYGHSGAVVWFTGLSGSGKTTLARGVERELVARGCHTMVLDGDDLRGGLSSDLGFSREERREHIRRAGEVASLLYDQGKIVLCAFVSPYRED